MAAGGAGEQFTAQSIQRLQHNITREEQYVVNFNYLKRKDDSHYGKLA